MNGTRWDITRYHTHTLEPLDTQQGRRTKMQLFIDESFKDIYVMAAVVGPRSEVEETIRNIRSRIRKNNKGRHHKQIVIPEIKDSLIHRKFPEIKKALLENLFFPKGMQSKRRENFKVYALYVEIKKSNGFSETEIYKKLAIALLQRVIADCTDKEIDICFDVYFDQYGEQIFRDKLYKEISCMFSGKTISLTHVSSQQDKAIQATDVVTGTIRRHLTGEDYNGIDNFVENIIVMQSIELR